MSKYLKIFGAVIIVPLIIGMLVASCFLNQEQTIEPDEKPNIEYSAVQYNNAEPLPNTEGIKLLP